MAYTLQDLLKKIGSPEVKARKETRWYYTDQEDSEYGGFADIKLHDNDTILTIDLYHRKNKEKDGIGIVHNEKIESFAMQAEKSTKDGLFHITSLAFDGEIYNPKDEAMVELACSVFYSRAIEISTSMMRKEFIKLQRPEMKSNFIEVGGTVQRLMIEQSSDAWGVVVPFPSRISQQASL